MTSQKSFKARVRARMDKTGESYTTARRHLIIKTAADSATAASTGPATEPAVPTIGAIRDQRFSDESMRQRTGRGWDEWFSLLDAWHATGHTHGEIARWLVAEHQVAGWWAQTITVGYEQARGMRAPGQTSNGDFSAGASRTIAVPAERLFAAFTDESVRRRWLPEQIRIRTANPPRTLRADWADATTRIVVGLTPKGDAKVQVAIQHEKITDAEAAARIKAYWRDRLAALKHLLES